MPMHFLGGLWVGLFFLYGFYDKNEFFKQFVVVLAWVLCIGVLYELFEVYTHNYIAQDPFNTLDTLSDIFFDLSGGLCAILYLWKKQQR